MRQIILFNAGKSYITSYVCDQNHIIHTEANKTDKNRPKNFYESFLVK